MSRSLSTVYTAGKKMRDHLVHHTEVRTELQGGETPDSQPHNVPVMKAKQKPVPPDSQMVALSCGPHRLHRNTNALTLVQFSRSVMSDSLQPPRLQHARPPSPSLIPAVYSNPCPLSQ